MVRTVVCSQLRAAVVHTSVVGSSVVGSERAADPVHRPTLAVRPVHVRVVASVHVRVPVCPAAVRPRVPVGVVGRAALGRRSAGRLLPGEIGSAQVVAAIVHWWASLRSSPSTFNSWANSDR